jgi:hypothetical protein
VPSNQRLERTVTRNCIAASAERLCARGASDAAMADRSLNRYAHDGDEPTLSGYNNK